MAWPWSELRDEMTALKQVIVNMSALQRDELLPRICDGMDELAAWREKTDLRLELIEQAVNRALHELTRLTEKRR